MNFPDGIRVYLDTNIWIYLAEGHPQLVQPISQLTDILAGGSITPVASTLTWGECLIRPIRQDDQVRIAGYNKLFSESDALEIWDISQEVIFLAAHIRGKTNLPFPDAIHLASASLSGCRVFLTNDQRLRKSHLPDLATPLEIQGFE